jgi:serine protease
MKVFRLFWSFGRVLISKFNARLILIVLVNFSVSNSLQAQSANQVKINKIIKSNYIVEFNIASPIAGAKIIRSLGKGRHHNLKLISTNLKDFCKNLIKSRAAKYCIHDFKIKMSEAFAGDPSLTSLWGLSSKQGINAPNAWELSTGSEDVVVALIDTGIDYRHLDLAANVWTNSGEIPDNGLDDDGNGYVDDIHGWNAVSDNGDPFDDNGHGTHCAGTIGAVGSNDLGVVGVNWNVKIMGLKFLDKTGSGTLSGALEVINYMLEMKSRGVNIKVANNSWNDVSYSRRLLKAIDSAGRSGIIFVAAAGNDGSDNDRHATYPANYKAANVISVAAADREGNLANFSNYGERNVDIAAPGVNILSTFPKNKYLTLSGTSMAVSHVTGSLALLFANEPELSVPQAIERLYGTGKYLRSLTGLLKTSSMLNAGNLLHNSAQKQDSRKAYSKKVKTAAD